MDLAPIARAGVFATADARRVGLDANALRRLVASGAVVRLSRGWFAVHDGGHLTAERRHVLTATALGRQYRDRAALSHHSMLLIAKIPTYAADLATVHLTSVVDRVHRRDDEQPPTRRNVSVRRSGVAIHEPIDGLRVTQKAGGGGGSRPLVVPVATAVVQAGLLSGPEAFLVPADASVRSGLATKEEIADAGSRLGGHTGIGPVRAVLDWIDGRHESPGETRTAFALRALGFELEPQIELVAEGRRFRPDFRIKGTRVLVEFDGAVKYQEARDLFAEKRREDSLRRAGWVLVRIVWADLANVELIRRRVLDALAAAA